LGIKRKQEHYLAWLLPFIVNTPTTGILWTVSSIESFVELNRCAEKTLPMQNKIARIENLFIDANNRRQTARRGFFARLEILLQNRALNSNPIEGVINVTRSHSSAQFNNILSIIPLFLPGLDSEFGSGKKWDDCGIVWAGQMIKRS